MRSGVFDPLQVQTRKTTFINRGLIEDRYHGGLKLMLIPVRCFTCGKVIGQLYDEYSRKVEGGEDPGKVLDSLGVERYCCRRMFLGHVDLMDDILPFS